MSKIFLLGLGAQKCGSTWLYNYIQSNPEADLGFAKEYHIFDALWVKEPEICKEFLQKRINKMVRSPFEGNEDDKRLLEFLGDPDKYFSYFKSLVCTDVGIHLTGDITPSYAALPKFGFRQIQSMAKKYGFQTKVIFIMRDPVERCISANWKHIAKRKSFQHLRDIDENSALSEFYRNLGCQLRTRYDLTIQNIESVFTESEIFYGLYENFFNENSLINMCNFLQIPYKTANVKHHINSSGRVSVIEQSLVDEIRVFYDPVYEFMGKKFGENLIRQHWKNF
jgi:hypothetical protein